eukprot:SAG31_NODE_836_length_11643_cov_3.389813_12_plen_99_part_00
MYQHPSHPRCEIPAAGTLRDGRTAAWEGGCWDPDNPGDAWLGDSFEEEVTKAVDAMKTSDWLALFFAASIASLSMVSEAIAAANVTAASIRETAAVDD